MRFLLCWASRGGILYLLLQLSVASAHTMNHLRRRIEHSLVQVGGPLYAEQDVRSAPLALLIDTLPSGDSTPTLLKRDGRLAPASFQYWFFAAVLVYIHFARVGPTWKASWSCCVHTYRVARDWRHVPANARVPTWRQKLWLKLHRTKPTPTDCIAQDRMNEWMHACAALLTV